MLVDVLTVGVDLAAEDTTTCLAAIRWDGGTARVEQLLTRVGNPQIVIAARSAAKVGIDCPFGWPVPFIEFVLEHDRGRVSPRAGRPIDWRRRLANRMTDLVVRETIPLVPLSVSADRIGHAAMRCAALLAELAEDGADIDRSGRSGLVVEAYPAASLHRWGLTHRGYKRRANTANLAVLVDGLSAAAPWLDLGAYVDLCRTNDDAFDAVVAALTARAAVCGLTAPPTDEHMAVARREGWIAIPYEGSLRQLMHG